MLHPPPNAATEGKATWFLLRKEMTLLQILSFQEFLMRSNCPDILR